METTRVIKVKFGDILRRFNASVIAEGQLDLDIDGLRAKIITLFSFPPDIDFTLTYVDEDGDVVTLVNDDDLRDAVRQQLKFLRLEVQLNKYKFDRYSRSSGNSTPLRSPQVQNPLPSINNGVSEALKSLPDPLQLLCKSLDLASKAASQSSNHVINDLVECISKLGQSSLNFAHHSHDANLNTQNRASQVPTAPSVVLNVSKDGANTSSQTGASHKPTAPSVPAASNASRDAFMGDILNQMTSKKVAMPEMPTQKKLNLLVPKISLQDGKFSKDLTKRVVDTVDLNQGSSSNSNPSGCETMNNSPPVPDAPGDDGRKDNKKQNSENLSPTRPTGFGASAGFGPFGASVGFDTSSLFFPPATPGFLPRPSGFNEWPVVLNSVPDGCLHSSRPHRLHKKNSIHSDPMARIFHKGVQCDGCGVHPIAGPRYKSKVKQDYDLCSICFVELGNEADYVKLDRPMSYRHPRILKSLHDIKHWDGLPPGVFGHSGIKQAPRPILDSRFVLDVNLLDGTMIAPSTNFTKIWRMCNNGNVAWPQGVRLVWTGGQRFSHADSAELEIQEGGVPVDGELDIAVDFTSPDSPGSYRSVWRLVNPSGVKFGQHVWVQIEVEAPVRIEVIASLSDSVCDSLEGLNLNLPAESDNSKSPMELDVNANPFADRSNSVAIPAEVQVDEQGKKGPDLNFPINDTLLVGNGAADKNGQWPQAPISYPIIDFLEAAPDVTGSAPAAPFQPLPTMSAPSSSEGERKNSAVEEVLLKELEEMGFKEVDLNKEILRMNEYNLEQSVDELCGVAEWDPILEELEEMGFCDKEMNKKLLKKNNGSIKRVVMDILTAETD